MPEGRANQSLLLEKRLPVNNLPREPAHAAPDCSPPRPPRATTSVASWQQRLEEATLAGAVLGIAALTVTNVLLRNLWGASLPFAEEICQFLVIWATFAGLSYAARRHRHIRMTALLDLLSPRRRRQLEISVEAMTSLLMACLALFAWRYVRSVAELGGVSPVTRTPLWAVYLAAPVGFAAASWQYVVSACDTWRRASLPSADAAPRTTDPTAAHAPEAERGRHD